MSEVVKSLLIQLETELKQQQLWSNAAPAEAALASTYPFCCDTLRPEQWLQFVFLPKLWCLLEAGQPLPAKVRVLPYAEEAFKSRGLSVQPLLTLIGRIDNTLTGPS
ncbi:YqcC family protein [Arsukibacterium indicum]|uniref:YqcC family protein n=1 Tax=Arsukibacterium indicum TaxID=2848612 RepID=A0ABS6MHF7_9GAMM|nr:YqcC family protein [Arsukibacterium indicum]MBV2128229.1 YqcC family protein [Arsukibacterium indicum]